MIEFFQNNNLGGNDKLVKVPHTHLNNGSTFGYP